MSRLHTLSAGVLAVLVAAAGSSLVVLVLPSGLRRNLAVWVVGWLVFALVVAAAYTALVNRRPRPDREQLR